MTFCSLTGLRSEREAFTYLICKDMADIERLRISCKTKRKELDYVVITRKGLNWELDMLEEDIDYVSRIVSENEWKRHEVDVKIGERIAELELESADGTPCAKKMKIEKVSGGSTDIVV